MKCSKLIYVVFIFLVILMCGYSVMAKPLLINNSKIIAFGDSITYGYGLPKGVDNWTSIIAKRFSSEVIKAGVPGNSSKDGLQRINADVLANENDFVIINFGMNDQVLDSEKFVSLSQFEENIRQIVAEVRQMGAVPILVTTNYIIEGDSTQYYYSRHNKDLYNGQGGAQVFLDSYINAVRNVAEELKVPLADVRKECEKYNRYDFLASLKNSSVDDGVHISKLGAKVYADVIGDCLKNYKTQQQIDAVLKYLYISK